MSFLLKKMKLEVSDYLLIGAQKIKIMI